MDLGAFYDNGSSDALIVDPNVPISVQFHTYSSNVSGSGAINNNSPYLNLSSTKRNAPHQEQVMMMMTTSTSGRPASSGRGNHASKDKDHSSYSRHREMHKTLEKNRRAHLRHCFEILKEELPRSEYNEKKTSHINIIRCAIRYIQQLKRTESEHEHEMERLARTKTRFQTQLAQLKEELLESGSKHCVDIDDLLRIAAERGIGGVGVASSGYADVPDVQSTIYVGQDDGDDDQSDGDVIIDVGIAEEYDDETTTTASGL